SSRHEETRLKPHVQKSSRRGKKPSCSSTSADRRKRLPHIQNMIRIPKRKYLESIRRPWGRVCVIWPNPPRLLTEPSALVERFDRLLPGLARCLVLLTLSASARIWNLIRSVIGK